MLNIGNILYLLAALGLALPLIIHLLNRKPLRVIEVGSIRWLKGSSTRAIRSLKLEDWPLLMLRCLMLLLFSFLLAGLYWERADAREEERTRPYLIHANSLPHMRASLLDSLQRNGLQLRLLAPGLPPLSDSLRWRDRPVNIWAVMREAEQERGWADSIYLRTPLVQAAFGGERPVLHKNFILIEEERQPEKKVLYSEAILLETGVLLQQALSDAENIRFSQDTISLQEWSGRAEAGEQQPGQPDTIKVSILADEHFQRDSENLSYAFEVALGADPSRILLLNTDTFFTAKNDTANNDTANSVDNNDTANYSANYIANYEANYEAKMQESDVLLWLSEEKMPEFKLENKPKLKQHKKPLIIYYGEQESRKAASGSRSGEGKSTHSSHQWLVPDYSRPREEIYLLSDRVLPERVSREKLGRLPLELARLLQHPMQENIRGHLPMPLAQARPLKATGSMDTPQREAQAEGLDLHEWLWLLLFGVFATERIWVYLK